MSISGPYERWAVQTGFTKHTRWFRQNPITNEPLPYQMDLVKTTGSMVHASRSDDYLAWLETAAYNACYSKFVNKVQEASAAIGAGLGERHTTLSMLTSRALQLLLFTRSISRGHFKQAARVLGVKKPKSTGDLLANSGDAWLEYSYGWKPLIQDIYNAADVLQQPWPKELASARSCRTYYHNGSIYKGFESHEHEYRCLIQARVEVVNWPVWKANQLGLINPLSVAWELVPFSFVVDWFVPVGTFLQSLTDFAGLNLSSAFVTHSRRHRMEVIKETPYVGSGTRLGMMIQRFVGSVPSPRIQNQFSGFYSARGANAIALLLSGLRSVKP